MSAHPPDEVSRWVRAARSAFVAFIAYHNLDLDWPMIGQALWPAALSRYRHALPPAPPRASPFPADYVRPPLGTSIYTSRTRLRPDVPVSATGIFPLRYSFWHHTPGAGMSLRPLPAASVSGRPASGSPPHQPPRKRANQQAYVAIPPPAAPTSSAAPSTRISLGERVKGKSRSKMVPDEQHADDVTAYFLVSAVGPDVSYFPPCERCDKSGPDASCVVNPSGSGGAPAIGACGSCARKKKHCPFSGAVFHSGGVYSLWGGQDREATTLARAKDEATTVSARVVSRFPSSIALPPVLTAAQLTDARARSATNFFVLPGPTSISSPTAPITFAAPSVPSSRPTTRLAAPSMRPARTRSDGSDLSVTSADAALMREELVRFDAACEAAAADIEAAERGVRSARDHFISMKRSRDSLSSLADRIEASASLSAASPSWSDDGFEELDPVPITPAASSSSVVPPRRSARKSGKK